MFGMNMSLKNPLTPPGIDPGTIRLVAQCLNHYTTPGPSLEVIRFVLRERSCLISEHLVIIFKLLRHLHGQHSGFHQLRFFNCMQWGKNAICAMQEFTWLFIVLILWLRLAAAHLNVNSHYQILWHCNT